MNRINKKFRELAKKKQKALITYVTAGDPDLNSTEKIIYAKINGGADVIELGIPFSDPLADGPVIQEASLRSLQQGTTPEKVFSLIEKVREKTDIPLVLLVYYNTILSYGVEKFVDRCKGNIDGVIIPDLPFEESGEVMPYFNQVDTALIPMLSPTSQDRIEKILNVFNEKGFVYCVTSLGVTGMDSSFYKDLDHYLATVRNHSKIPICAGFGIKDKNDFNRISPLVDGVIIGSAIVKEIFTKGFSEQGVKNYVAIFKE